MGYFYCNLNMFSLYIYYPIFDNALPQFVTINLDKMDVYFKI